MNEFRWDDIQHFSSVKYDELSHVTIIWYAFEKVEQRTFSLFYFNCIISIAKELQWDFNKKKSVLFDQDFGPLALADINFIPFP